MPWLSIPIQSQNVIQHYLSSSFWVYSIPTLIVLTKEGKFVTNNAKVQIDNLISKDGDESLIIQSWGKELQVPIDDAYLGVIP